MRVVLAGLAAILLAGLIAPFINAARFSGSIHRALEASLGRKVEFDRAYFTLFSGPGFSLENVTIHDDPRYGPEPFAYVATLQARLRLDKLLLGQLRFSSLRLVDPSLNFIKRTDGTWNVVELVSRLSAPRRLPLNLFPAIEISDGRIDFQFGHRKTTLYIAAADLSLYPQRSGKVYIQFSGSPARTDRAGNGFGHLRGTANWYLNPATPRSNQLEADVTLDPSNLSELTTLIQGHDLGVHGTVSSHARIEGPATALRIGGELRLEDVHRWDLLPASGEDWRIRYRGDVDLIAHRFDLETLPPQPQEVAPVALRVRVNDFLTRPAWSIFARFEQAPVQDLLPLGRRMGLAVPAGLNMKGTLDGVVGYSNTTGLAGGLALRKLSAELPNASHLETELAQITVSPNNLHLDPAIVQNSDDGTLQVGGDYALTDHRLTASLVVNRFPIAALKSTADAWFGAPAALQAFRGGTVSGRLVYLQQEPPPASVAAVPSSWSGEVQFSGASIAPEGLAMPLEHSQGRLSFDDKSLELNHFTALLGHQAIAGSYHYNAAAKRPERVHLDIPSADLTQLEAALDPTLEAQGLLARLRFTSRTVPAWLAARNLEGDLAVHDFSVNQAKLGPLSAHFVWLGTNLEFSTVQLNVPGGLIRAHGAVSLASYSPHCRFDAEVSDFAWRGGTLNAAGRFETSGILADSLQHLQAGGTFTAEDVSLSADDDFDRISGLFAFSFDGGRPALRLNKVQAWQGEDTWEGEGASQEDGKLAINLQHEGRQLHLVSSLEPENTAPAPSLSTRIGPQ